MEIVRQYWGIICFGIAIIGALMGDHFFIQAVRSQVKTLFTKLDELRDRRVSKLERDVERLKAQLEFLEKYAIRGKS